MAENLEDRLRNTVLEEHLTSAEVKFEKLSLKDEEEYLGFLMEAYRNNFNHYRFEERNLVRKFWRWEYLDNPNSCQDSPSIWLCRFKNKIIAQFCIMPIELKVENKLYKAGWCQDVMVLPQFRNRGLGYFIFQYLSKDLNDIFDILLVSGTNKDSYTLLKNVGFLDIGFFSRNIKPTNIKNIIEKFTPKKFPPLLFALFTKSISVILKLPYIFNVRNYNQKNIKIFAVDDFDQKFDSFYTDISGQSPCMVKRDTKNLTWRFRRNPFWRYVILAAKEKDILKGYVVLKESHPNKKGFEELRVGVISDILFDLRDRDIGFALIDAAIDYFKGKVDLVRCDVLCKGLMPIIQARGFIGIKSSNRFLIYPLGEELKNNENKIVIEKKNWYLTFFDSDLDL